MSHRELEMESILGPEMEVDLVCLRNSMEARGQGSANWHESFLQLPWVLSTAGGIKVLTFYLF